MFTFRIQKTNFSYMMVLLYAVSIFYPLNLPTLDHVKVFAQNDKNVALLPSVQIKGLNINVSLAETPEQQTKGLSIKNTLGENEGMLFVFDTPKKNSFWMKDMKFPIDIIWISSNHTIIHIEKSLSPCISFLFCPSYSPEENSQFVLEVNSNYTTK